MSLVKNPKFHQPKAIVALGVCVCFSAAFLAVTTTAGALTYSKEFCGSVRKTRAGLVKAGVLADMTKGAHWAKANLAPDKLARIKRYLRIDEIVQFQCTKLRKKKVRPKAKPRSKNKTKSKTKPAAKVSTKRRPTKPKKRKTTTKPTRK